MRRSWRILIHVGFWSSASLGVVAACIPDLPPDAVSPGVVARCGDGYIDLAAGEECDPSGLADADLRGCSKNCKVLCAGLKWARNDHCYDLLPMAAGALQAEANARCARLSATSHVATFASEAEFEAVARYVADADAGAFWVGLSEGQDRYNSVNPYEPGWSPSCSGCYAHTADPGSPLPRSPEALLDPMAAGCVEAFPDSARRGWAQYPCSATTALRVVCEHEPEGVHSIPCEAGTCLELVATRGAKRYVYVSAPLPDTHAENRCHELGGTLVVLQSRDEREQLWLELSRLDVPPTRFWIGLSSSADAASADGGDAGAVGWVWDDRATATDYPATWAVGQPSGSAHAFLSHVATLPPLDDTLARADRTTALPFVCQILEAADGASR